LNFSRHRIGQINHRHGVVLLYGGKIVLIALDRNARTSLDDRAVLLVKLNCRDEH
jgi:hypothetical protein